jgi:hydroxymethylglutaryl-CoA reductase
MSLIIGDSIRRKEFGAEIPGVDREVIIRSARVDLTTAIRGDQLPKGTRLLKAYATSPNGARRIVFLLEVEEGDLFLLFYRNKKDAVGANMTIQNKAFKTQLDKHLNVLRDDLDSGNYEVVDL